MKLAALLVLCSAAAFAQIAQHLQGGLIDAQVASYTVQEPDLPGMNAPSNFLAISFSSSDHDAMIFTVVLRVKLDDGSSAPLRRTIERADTGNTVIRMPLFGHKPVAIEEFYVVRQHSEPIDSLVHISR